MDPNWAHHGTMQEVIGNERPPTYTDWDESVRTVYDHQTFMGASMERLMKQNYDRQEKWNRIHSYSFEQEMNNRNIDDRNRRLHDGWHAGRLVVPDPPIMDYTTLPPYDGSVSYTTPRLHHSQWVDPHTGGGRHVPSQQSGEGGGEGSISDGAFGFGKFSEMMTSIFGPPQPRYY
ncbi:hypothetical protein Hanom_Chr00s156130g01823701 [Helianthus anomalus]